MDLNVVLMVVAAIVLVASLAVLAQKRKGRRWLVLRQGAEPEVDKTHDDNQDDDFRKANGEVGQVHCGSIR